MLTRRVTRGLRLGPVLLPLVLPTVGAQTRSAYEHAFGILNFGISCRMFI